MWTRLNPFRTVRRILDLWERQIQAQEQANALAVVAATAGTLPASITAAAQSRLADGFNSTLPRKPSANASPANAKPLRKLDASNVTLVTRRSRIAHQFRERGRRLHGETPNPTPTANRPPSGATDAD